MGSNLAYELASQIDLPLETQIGYHLQGNHYPKPPLSMVQPCIQAIDAYYDEDIIVRSKCLKEYFIEAKLPHPPGLL